MSSGLNCGYRVGELELYAMFKSSKEAIEKTMKQINEIVASNLGYDSAHVWVFVEEVEHDHFLTAGKTWEELKPLLYKGKRDE